MTYGVHLDKTVLYLDRIRSLTGLSVYLRGSSNFIQLHLTNLINQTMDIQPVTVSLQDLLNGIPTPHSPQNKKDLTRRNKRHNILLHPDRSIRPLIPRNPDRERPRHTFPPPTQGSPLQRISPRVSARLRTRWPLTPRGKVPRWLVVREGDASFGTV